MTILNISFTTNFAVSLMASPLIAPDSNAFIQAPEMKELEALKLL